MPDGFGRTKPVANGAAVEYVWEVLIEQPMICPPYQNQYLRFGQQQNIQSGIPFESAKELVHPLSFSQKNFQCGWF